MSFFDKLFGKKTPQKVEEDSVDIDSLLKYREIQSWHQKVTATYDEPDFIMVVIPTLSEINSFMDSLSFVAPGPENELVITSGTIAPMFSHQLKDGRWVVCLCGGFTRDEYKEVFDLITSKEYVAYCLGKDAILERLTIYP